MNDIPAKVIIGKYSGKMVRKVRITAKNKYIVELDESFYGKAESFDIDVKEMG